jgi:hypothetical protein
MELTATCYIKLAVNMELTATCYIKLAVNMELTAACYTNFFRFVHSHILADL